MTDFDECHSNPCMNTGSCNNLINSYSCDCTGRYDGDVCQTDCRPGPADIVFIIDTSSSLETNINRSLGFITEFIKRIPIGTDDFQMLTNKSFGSRRISSYIIMLYDGLSTDSNNAVHEAMLINSIGGRVITVAVGQSISYSEMLLISRKQYYTFSTSFFDDMLNNILKETVPENCTGRTDILSNVSLMIRQSYS
ncbi:unnamed protein product [Mytilus edulis]|uniref:Uncharacterized protein n=1 Tax=Mytilus edulis TaxID=6550 RepID=A0A8S3R9C5_MYTED|nr:unnamed protein product [Mytilus edulis]